MMTKKQLIQALSVLQDEDQVMACYKGKYTSEIDSCVTGVKIIFKQDLPQVIILVAEMDDEDVFKAA
jgi:hypothetical protein